MQEILFYVGIACAILAGIFLIASIVMFFNFRIPVLWKDSKGTLEQKQIEEIRGKNSNLANRRNKVNVFEELEKKAKVRKNNTQSLNLGSTGSLGTQPSNAEEQGTMVLQSSSKVVNSNFVIEKNMMFVSTSEVI